MKTKFLTKLMIRILKRSCTHGNISSLNLNLKWQDTEYSVFNYAIENFNTKTVEEGLAHLFNKIKWAAKVNIALDSIEKKRWRFQIDLRTRKQYTAVSIIICVHHGRNGQTKRQNKTHVIKCWSWERMNTKWMVYKLSNLTVFAALLTDVLMGCKNVVLPEALLKNCTINCLRYE